MHGGLGAHGEALAAAHLQALGYRVLERNWRSRPARDGLRGEADLVTEHEGHVVVVEVKTRSSLRYGHPFEAITAQKVLRLHRLAAAWARAHGRDPRLIRVDAVAITIANDGSPSVEVLRQVI
ncbi:YraN family protein [Kocuria sp. M1R5S2]|uniref:YraN family protein n=1 Tax=Kocuria rhizosphaerae TaxID=3376285 RepID=UPI00379E864F